MGAKKATKTFAEIEKEAEMADQMKVSMDEERKANEVKRVENEAVAAANIGHMKAAWSAERAARLRMMG